MPLSPDAKMNMREKLLQISKETGVSLKKLYDFLYILREGNAIENNKMVREIGVSKNALNKAKERLSFLLEKPSSTTQIMPSELEKVNELFTESYAREEMIINRLYNKKIEYVIKVLSKYKSLRPPTNRSLDQFTATLETTARRAVLLMHLEDLDSKNIAFLGDDDLTSVAVCLLSKPNKVTVFEIDSRIAKAIQEIAKRENIDVQVVKYDARKPIPKNYIGSYDVVFTDPPYTPDGISLFLSRCIDLLDLESLSSRVYLCYGNSDRAKERFLSIQKVIVDSGLMVRYLLDKFNRYLGAESIGSSSSLYITEVTSMTRPTIQGEFNEKIYTI